MGQSSRWLSIKTRLGQNAPLSRFFGWTPSFNARTFVVLTCGGLILLNILHDWQSRSASLRAMQTVNSSLAHSLAQHAEDTIGAADAVLISTASYLDRGSPGLNFRAEVGQDMAALVAQSDSLSELSIFAADGTLLISSMPTAPVINVRELSFFQHHLLSDDPQPFLGPPIMSQSRSTWKLTVSRRLEQADHQFAGVVVASLNSAYFERYYRALGLGSQAAISAFRTDGTMLFRYPSNLAYLTQSYTQTELFRAWNLSHHTGVSRYTSRIDSVDRVAAFDTSGKYSVIVNVAASVNEALADWRREMLWDLAGYGVLAGIVIWLGNRLERQAKRQKAADRTLAENELHFRLLTELSGDMVTQVDMNGLRTYVSPASTKLLGWGAEQLLGTSALHGSDAEDKLVTGSVLAALREGVGTDSTIAYRAIHRAGHQIWIEANIRVTFDPDTGRSNGAVMISRDITARKALEAGLELLATTDGLTGVANRRRLDEVMQSEWRRSARAGTALSMALIDVDMFKSYNDRYGHQEGDECLRCLAQTLSAVFRRPGDLLARYGGEEFGAVLPVTEAHGAWEVAEAARDAVEKLHRAHEGSRPAGIVTISVGVATAYPAPDQDMTAGLEKLLHTADAALYQAKHAGRNRVESIQSRSPVVLNGGLNAIAAQ